MSNQLRNYFLDNSPCATIIMDSPEEPPKKSRKLLPQEGRAGKEAELARIEYIMEELQILVEQWRAQIQGGTESHEVQLQRLERVKAQAEILRGQIDSIDNHEAEMQVHLGKRVAEFQSGLAELEVQIHKRKADTSSNVITSQQPPLS